MIELKNLTKKFDDFTAVDSINLEIERRIFRIIRRKRSGKDNDNQYAFHIAVAYIRGNLY